MRKITQTIVGTIPPLDKNVIWLDNTDSTAPIEKVFINGVWTPMGVDTDDYYTKEEVNDKLDEKLNVIENPVNGNLIAMDSQGQAIDSGKKIGDFIANPIDSGSEGEVLSVDSEGNPVWTTVTPTGTADTEMSDTSTNAVQNKVIKSYVDNNCARKDGYYSTLTAGAAENLVGQTVDSADYLIRPTGGTENEVANCVVSVLGMEGNSTVWNQVIQNGDFSSSTGWGVYQGTMNIANNVLTYTPNNPSAGSRIINSTVLSGGHKYYFRWTIKPNGYNSNTKIILKPIDTSQSNVSGDDVSIENGVKTLALNIVTPQYDSNILIYCNSGGGMEEGNLVELYSFNTIDLTLLGIDNLTTVADVEAWLAQHVGTKPYYAYNAGEILSAQTLGIKTYGQNLLNPTTKQAKLIPYTWVENGITYSNQYTIKNVPSGATATFTPDNTGVAESVTITDDMFDITNYGSGILELSAATADTYVCMKWDEGKDDDVVPYEDHTYDFDVRKVYGKVNGAGEYVQCFPSGLRSAGSVHDTLTANEAVVKVGSVDLGSLTWRYDYTMRTTLPFVSIINSISLISNYYTQVFGGWTALNGKDKCYAISSSPEMRIIDSNYTDATTFKIAMNGVMLNCRLATPITYTDLIYRNGGIDRPLADVLMNIEVNNWSMEEQLMTPYDENGNPTSIPATIKTQYGMDAVEAIDTLQKTCYFADDVRANLQALLTCINTNCAETLGGTFSISETATDKVFAFSFTPNVEPTNEGE